MWEPWTGCYKCSEGCTYCYYYGEYSKRHGMAVVRTDDFYRPLEMKSKNKYKIESGRNVATCFTTDFFLPEADEWRIEAWEIIKKRSDLEFMFLTKRINRFNISLPDDWGDGYNNVTIGCTCENQEMLDYRLPLFLSLPIKKKFLCLTPLLSEIDLTKYDISGIEQITVGGESGREARECHFDWILNIREQCVNKGIKFWFKCTGSRFVKDGILEKVGPRIQHTKAREFGLNIE